MEALAEAVANLEERGQHRVLMPDAESFSDVLEYIGPFERESEEGARYIPDEVPPASDWERSSWHYRPGDAHYGRNQIGPYCTINLSQFGGTRHRSMAVRATDAAMDAIRERGIVTPDDTLTFEVIGHKHSGRALVILEHGYIIGGMYLAYIDPETIPGH